MVEYTPVEEKSTWQRIGDGFVDSLSDIWEGFVNFFVWVLANSPRLVLWGGIITVVVLLIRRANKRRKAKKNPPVTE